MAMLILSDEQFLEECKKLGINPNYNDGNLVFDARSISDNSHAGPENNSHARPTNLLNSGPNKLLADYSLNNFNQNSQSAEIVSIKRGRGHTDNIPMSVRQIIAETAIASTCDNSNTTEEIAKAFGVSKQSVAAYKHGATSEATYNELNPELINHVNSVKSEIGSSARKKLIEAISCITIDKLEAAKVRDVASVAKDMSLVSKHMEINQDDSVAAKVTIYRPKVRELNEFQVIDVD